MPIVPLIDQQRRMAEVGRIRLGKKVPTQNGKSRPAKIDKFRLTSRDKARLDAAAALYGGEVTAWEGQWELYTDATAIPIAVVPGQALNVSYELWGQKTIDGKKSPVICLRRCDGEYESKSDGPCLCAQQPDMTCKPTARLSVVLTDVPGLGVWRLESHGWNALTELQGTVQLLEMLVASGRPIRARLRLDKRESPHESGTRKFVVPTIDIDHTMGQVLDAIGVGGVPAAPPVEIAASRGGFTPVPELPAAPAAAIADQVRAVEAPAAAAPRKNAQQPIPATGLSPRTVGEVSGPGTAPDGAGQAASASPAAQAPASGGGDGDHPDVASPDVDDGPTMPLASRIAMWCNDAGLDNDGRHAFLYAFSDGAYQSAKNVPAGAVPELRAALVRLARGETELDRSGDTPVLREAVTGFPSTDPGGQSPARTGGPVDPDQPIEPPVTPELLPNWSRKTVRELSEACRERGLDDGGTKTELIARLEAAA